MRTLLYLKKEDKLFEGLDNGCLHLEDKTKMTLDLGNELHPVASIAKKQSEFHERRNLLRRLDYLSYFENTRSLYYAKFEYLRREFAKKEPDWVNIKALYIPILVLILILQHGNREKNVKTAVLDFHQFKAFNPLYVSLREDFIVPEPLRFYLKRGRYILNRDLPEGMRIRALYESYMSHVACKFKQQSLIKSDKFFLWKQIHEEVDFDKLPSILVDFLSDVLIKVLQKDILNFFYKKGVAQGCLAIKAKILSDYREKAYNLSKEKQSPSVEMAKILLDIHLISDLHNFEKMDGFYKSLIESIIEGEHYSLVAVGKPVKLSSITGLDFKEDEKCITVEETHLFDKTSQDLECEFNEVEYIDETHRELIDIFFSHDNSDDEAMDFDDESLPENCIIEDCQNFDNLELQPNRDFHFLSEQEVSSTLSNLVDMRSDEDEINVAR